MLENDAKIIKGEQNAHIKELIFDTAKEFGIEQLFNFLKPPE